MDTIFISELKIETRIGIYEWERKVAQNIQLDLDIGLRDARAAQSGNLDDTIDYSKVVGRIEALFAGQHFDLLETAAETIAGIVLNDFGAPWVRVSIAKLGALRSVKKLGITIERGKRA